MLGPSRQRDLLPLRLPVAEDGIFDRDLSRGTRQRILRRLAADAWFREGVQTLNNLYDGSDAGPFAPIGSQAAALSSLAQKYRCVGPPPQSRPEEALQALLGSMSVYSSDNIECNIASFDEALVSCPEPGSRPVRIAQYLAPDVSKLLSLANSSELLADEDALSRCEPVRPYIDQILAHSPVHMGRFFGRLFKSRMLQLVPGKFDHTVGLFFVRKKSGKLRLILDTRGANNYFVKPRPSRLPTPADFVTPEYATLPMGWNLSLYFCQSLLAPRPISPKVIALRTVPGQGMSRSSVSFTPTDAQHVQLSFDRMKDILEECGFGTHEITEAQPVANGLGLVIDGDTKTRIPHPGQDLEAPLGCTRARAEAGATTR